jgi:hypothetical protein
VGVARPACIPRQVGRALSGPIRIEPVRLDRGLREPEYKVGPLANQGPHVAVNELTQVPAVKVQVPLWTGTPVALV